MPIAAHRHLALLLALLALHPACDDPDRTPDTTADAIPDTAPDPTTDLAPPLADAAPDTLTPDATPDAILPDADIDDPDRPPLFAAGCPRPGRALARRIDHPDARLDGPDALAAPGDWLLANPHAAFVITGDGPQRTYYYYPGVPVDAVPLRDCRQAAPDRFEEIGWLVGRARLDRYPHSTLRAFHGTRWEVIADGTDGTEARLRVTGFDDTQWLVENELIRAAHREDDPRAPSVALGIEIIIDYVLPPDSPVLRIEIGIHNLGNEGINLATLAMAQFADTAPTTSFQDGRLQAAGFTVRRGLPWIASRAPDVAHAIALHGGPLSNAYISGVDALFDFDQLLAAPYIAPGATHTTTWLLAVAPDLDAIGRALHPINPTALRGEPYSLGEVSGRVIDEATGAPVTDAHVTVELPTQDARYAPITELRVDSTGRFTGLVPDLGDGLRLRADAPGRHPTTVEVAPEDPTEATLTLAPPGTLTHHITDATGQSIPAIIELWQGDTRTHRIAALAREQTQPIPPGAYEAIVTRGFEHTRHVQAIDIPPGATARLDATLDRIIDTTGWLATDGHAHAAPSSDSDVSLADRIAYAAAAGLEVAIGTDHEIIADWHPGVLATDLAAHINTAAGQEVTATLPEHINAYPFDLRPDIARGDPVVWYGMDIGAVYAAIHDRGAPIAQLNHPRGGCNYMCLIDYDRITGAARLDDPTRLGMPADAELWSWDFQAFELMNGTRSPYLDPRSPKDTGLFEDWQSFLNHGHRVTAMGVSDVHGLDQGMPITWFRAPTDDPRAFTPAMLTEAIQNGRAQVSAGAFIEARIGDAEPGDLTPPADLHIRVQALPEIDIRTVVVYANCDQIAALEATPDAIVKLDEVIPLDLGTDAHLTIAAFGRDPMPRGLEGYDPRATPRAITNAIYIDADDNGRFDPPGGKECRYDIPAR